MFNALTRSLTFIDTHLYQLNTIEPAFALSALKGIFKIFTILGKAKINCLIFLIKLVVDDKHGGELQKKYPISEWISQICSTFSDNRGR